MPGKHENIPHYAVFNFYVPFVRAALIDIRVQNTVDSKTARFQHFFLRHAHLIRYICRFCSLQYLVLLQLCIVRKS